MTRFGRALLLIAAGPFVLGGCAPGTAERAAARHTLDPAMAQLEARLSAIERSVNTGAATREEAARWPLELAADRAALAGAKARVAHLITDPGEHHFETAVSTRELAHSRLRYASKISDPAGRLAELGEAFAESTRTLRFALHIEQFFACSSCALEPFFELVQESALAYLAESRVQAAASAGEPARPSAAFAVQSTYPEARHRARPPAPAAPRTGRPDPRGPHADDLPNR